MRLIALVLVVATVPAWASNPGEPLDCSDWVFLEPGLSCTTVIQYPCSLGTRCTTESNMNFDNNGRAFVTNETQLLTATESHASRDRPPED